MKRQGHLVSHQFVSEVLHARGDNVQANRKTREGEHADRNASCEHVTTHIQTVLAAGEPAVSVDAKKKERVGDVTNPGREWSPQGEPEEVRVSDVPSAGLGRATPDGVSDLRQNAGWVTVGIDHETAACAVERGRTGEYPGATRRLMSADGGGSNGSRLRFWTWERQQVAETGLEITVCHVSPGTSTGKKREHRLCAQDPARTGATSRFPALR